MKGIDRKKVDKNKYKKIESYINQIKEEYGLEKLFNNKGDEIAPMYWYQKVFCSPKISKSKVRRLT